MLACLRRLWLRPTSEIVRGAGGSTAASRRGDLSDGRVHRTQLSHSLKAWFIGTVSRSQPQAEAPTRNTSARGVAGPALIRDPHLVHREIDHFATTYLHPGRRPERREVRARASEACRRVTARSSRAMICTRRRFDHRGPGRPRRRHEIHRERERRDLTGHGADV